MKRSDQALMHADLAQRVMASSMPAKPEKRIGIFEYDWALHSFTKDFVLKLAEAGYLVDVFQKDQKSGLKFANAEQFKHYRNVRYFDFQVPRTRTQAILRKGKGLLGRLNENYRQSPRNIIDGSILLRSQTIIAEAQYLCFIGIEKKGLLWAGILSGIYKCPLIYYSLELYLEDHPGAKGYSYLRKAEKHYHQLSTATIIQDRLRAEALLKYNEVGSDNALYFPICARGPVVENKSRFFQNKFQISEPKTFLLCYGQIQDERFSAGLIRIADRLRENMMLVLHGFGDPAYLEYLKQIADKERVLLSFDFVPEEDILDVISSATIGLALYEKISSNDRLAAFSSAKVAYYMQCGIPVIAFKSESFTELMHAYKCGELILSLDEIPQAVEKILNDYDSYSDQAFKAFKKYYALDQKFTEFLPRFEALLNNNHITAKSGKGICIR